MKDGTNWADHNRNTDDCLARSSVKHAFPNFDKTLAERPTTENGAIASYELVFNGKGNASDDTYGGIPDLSQYNGNLKIEDTMSENLEYLHDLSVFRRNSAGEEVISPEFYTAAFDSANNKLTVNISNEVLGKYEYILRYSARLTDKEGYYNSASANFGAKVETVRTETRTEYDLIFDANQREVIVHKVNQNNKPLAGVKFGLFYKDGTKIAEGVTRLTEDGGAAEVSFKTDVTQGISFGAHIPYYIQEIETLAGYKENRTKYYFYFCRSAEGCGKDAAFDSAYSRLYLSPDTATYTLPDIENDLILKPSSKGSVFAIKVKKNLYLGNGTEKMASSENFTFKIEGKPDASGKMPPMPTGNDGIDDTAVINGVTTDRDNIASFEDITLTSEGYTFDASGVLKFTYDI